VLPHVIVYMIMTEQRHVIDTRSQHVLLQDSIAQ